MLINTSRWIKALSLDFTETRTSFDESTQPIPDPTSIPLLNHLHVPDHRSAAAETPARFLCNLATPFGQIAQTYPSAWKLFFIESEGDAACHTTPVRVRSVEPLTSFGATTRVFMFFLWAKQKTAGWNDVFERAVFFLFSACLGGRIPSSCNCGPNTAKPNTSQMRFGLITRDGLLCIAMRRQI